MKDFRINLGVLWALFAIFLSPALNAQLLINEVCAANYTDFNDNFGETEDWFEIYNPTGADIDLDGYYFSDDVLEPTKYQVTSSVMVPAGGHRVVFASNRNTIVGNNIHTSFKINQKSQEYAVLADPTGSIVDVFWVENPNQMNHSWGRSSDGAGDWVIFNNPSPNASNSGGFSAYATTPALSVHSGAHGGPVTVSISSPDPGITIRYGLNGAEVNASSTVYTGPIDINSTTVLHARAYSNDPSILPSFMETNTYLIAEGHVLPVISISGPNLPTLMNGSQINPIGTLEFFGADGQLKDEARGDFNEHGNDSWAYDQRGIDYITRDQMGYNDEVHHPIFRTKERPSYQRLIIKAAANDNYPFSPPAGGGCHVIDAYIHSLSQIGELRLDERSHEPCVMYVNGQFWGVYDVREKVDDLDFTDYYYNQGQGEVDFWKTWGGTWDEFNSGTANEWFTLRDFIVTEDMTDPANYDYVKSVFNTGSLIDYFVLNSYVVTTDWLNWNTGWWRGKNPNGDKKKWRYILWDNDASFGQYINFTGIPDITPEADPCNPEQIGDPGGQGHVPILNALLNNEDFYNDYVSRFVDLSQSVFTCENMQNHLDSLTGLIAPEMPRQVARWGGSIAEWQDNIQVIRDFIDDRCAALNDGLLDCYDVEGPYSLVVEVQPPGSGWIELNSLDLTDFPWEGEYFGNLDIEMEAHGYGINVFSHWENDGHVFDPFVDTAFFTFQQADTITAWFVSTQSDITLEVIPDGVATIDFLSNTYTSFPVVVPTIENVDLDISTTPTDPFFEFDHWEADNHVLTPDMMTANAEINIDTVDHIRAVYNELENYIITIEMEGEGGTIYFNGIEIDNFPFVIQLLAGEIYTITAGADAHFTFAGWIVDGNTFIGDLTDPNNSFILTEGGNIIAIFTEDENYEVTYMVDPPGVGEIVLDGEVLPYYPYTEKYYLPDFERSLDAMPNEYYDLSHWTSEQNELRPDTYSESINLTLAANDTLVAYFVREQFGYFLPNAFSPNGDGHNDIYYVRGHAVDMSFYSFEIYDRNGQLVFKTDDINKGWSGAGTQDGDYFAPNGVYVYKLKVQSVFDNRTEEVMGNILLLR